MSLSEVMSRAGLTTFPIIALMIFVLTSVGIVIALFRRNQARDQDLLHGSMLPFDEGEGTAAPQVADTTPAAAPSCARSIVLPQSSTPASREVTP